MSAPTIREIHERCKARHHFEEWTLNPKGYYCGHCAYPWPCPDFEDAVAALATWDRLVEFLAEAERGISFNGDSKSILQQILKADGPPC